MTGHGHIDPVRSGFTVTDLAARFDRWVVTSVIRIHGLAEIRMRGPIDGAPGWVTTAGVLYVGSGAVTAGNMVGATVRLTDTRIEMGDSSFALSQLVAGRLLDTAVVVVPPPVPPPVTDPIGAATRVLEHGLLLWPLAEDLAAEHRGLELLAAVTRQALAAPSLVVSVEREPMVDDATRWDLFVTPTVGVELGRRLAEPVSVSYFPISDVPSRVLERAGVTGDETPAPAATCSVRVTYPTDQALITGALDWRFTGDGVISGEHSMSSEALSSELLRMLPGGEVPADGKEAVGNQ